MQWQLALLAPRLQATKAEEAAVAEQEGEGGLQDGDDVDDEEESKASEPSGLTCDNPGCGKSELQDDPFPKCSRCHIAKYCSRDCQIAHYPLHKQFCRRVGKQAAMQPLP